VNLGVLRNREVGAMILGGVYVFVVLFFLWFPIMFALGNSFMVPEEMFSSQPHVIPHHPTLHSYFRAVQVAPLFTFLRNSAFVSLGITLGELLVSSMAAYAFVFLHFPGRNLLFFFTLATMMVPWEVTLIPNYLTMVRIGWLDTYAGLIVPFLANAFGIFLLRQAFLQIPRELIEAAKIDGASHCWIYLRLVLPLAQPALATLGVYVFLTAWNLYLWPLILTNDESMRTVQIGIGMLQFQEFSEWNVVLAGIVIVLLPSLFALVVGLRYLISGLTTGALKG